MKNKIFVSLSIVSFILFALLNMKSIVNFTLGWGNFILSLLFIAFWGVMIKVTAEEKKTMIYSITLWSVIFLSTLISLIAAVKSVNVGFLMVPVSFLTAPMFGFRVLIKSSVANYSILLVVSAMFVGVSSYWLSRQSR